MVKSIRSLEAGYCVHPEAMVLSGGAMSRLRFPATVAVIEHQREGIILFDTGYSENFESLTANFPERLYRMVTPVTISPETTAKARLRELGISPKDVRHIIISHLHADHVGGLRDFPNALLHLDYEAYQFYSALSRFDQVRNGFLSALLPEDVSSRIRPITEKSFETGNYGLGPLTKGKDIFGDGSIIAIPLPGHMAGHLGILVHTESGDRSFFVGDAAWQKESFEQNRLPSFLTRLVIKDWKSYVRTLRELHEIHRAHPDLKIIPCHCEIHA